jgi:hypothetical protein
MICLTLLIGSSERVRRRLESRQQIGEAAEVVVPEIGAPCPEDRGGISGNDIGPPQRQPGKAPYVIVEIDAFLTPRVPAVDPSEGTPMKGMEGMRDSERLSLITRWRCNRRRTPMPTSNGSSGRFDENVSIT